MKNQTRKYAGVIAVPIALSVFVLGSEPAEAQRERPSREESREQRRQQIEQMTPEQREQYFRTRRQERERNMTPEQRQQWLERRQEWERRQAEGGGQGGQGNRGGRGGGRQQEDVDVMANAGITDPTVKDAIRAFVIAQQEARQPLLETARQITADLGKAEVTPAQIAARMTEFRAALAVDQKRYETALQELDAKIGYTKNPKLEAFLMMAGVLGYEAPQVGGSIAIFANLTPPAAPAAEVPGAAGAADGAAPMAAGAPAPAAPAANQ